MSHTNQIIEDLNHLKILSRQRREKVHNRVNRVSERAEGTSPTETLYFQKILFEFLVQEIGGVRLPLTSNQLLTRIIQSKPHLRVTNDTNSLMKLERALFKMADMWGYNTIGIKREYDNDKSAISIIYFDPRNLRNVQHIEKTLEDICDENSIDPDIFIDKTTSAQVPSTYIPNEEVRFSEDAEIEKLLSKPSFLEMEAFSSLIGVTELIERKTFREQEAEEMFQAQGNGGFREFCEYLTKQDCKNTSITNQPCTMLHFRRIMRPQTDLELGDCSYLNTCHRMDTCKYVHYELDDYEQSSGANITKTTIPTSLIFRPPKQVLPAQWINCDVRKFDFSILGKFSVIMADPPWDIHMTLPYGTMTDDEMKAMAIHELQDEGLIFLWVTGRAMELGRECLATWGYDRVDEVVWIKTNQLQRLIRTGRTGHWLNHSKEHCLVGIKGDPSRFNIGLACDVLVAEVSSPPQICRKNTLLG
ncbi:methyltransferase, variant 2 [Basidiobolus ranarum]|uniref:mRNA m(6)A methyltransferase n=1 Tax=Basidiobolus ranarum TaxID=34480 RepID=A0ABR2X3N2_9FUNG